MLKSYTVFYRPENKLAAKWSVNIKNFVKVNFPKIHLVTKNPDLVIALGGDGTILSAAKKYYQVRPIIFGLNLGTVGFLAAARKESDFLSALKAVFSGNFRTTGRIMLSVKVFRKNKNIFLGTALNEALIQNPLAMVDAEVRADSHPIQYIRGTGVMVSTPNGSTGYNLSAHGPILMPDMECFVITEILDHNIPTPPIVLKSSSSVEIRIKGFKKRGILSISAKRRPFDVILSLDNDDLLPLKMNDKIIIRQASTKVTFAEIEDHYFLKSLKEKFGYK